MSKLKADNILFDEQDFLVEVGGNRPLAEKKSAKTDENKKKILDQENQILSNAKAQASQMLNKSQFEANKILEEAQTEANEILASAKEEAQSLKDEAKKTADNELESAKEEIEAFRIEEAKRGYSEGHEDGLIKIKEELEEKIEAFDNFIKTQFEAKEKILNSLSNDILDIISAISKKILLKELDSETLDKIIKATIAKLEKKENITIILSEKYARLLFELQQNKLEDDNAELKFEDFKQYENFEIVYNPKFAPDTIIVENLKERLDASITSQLDIIIRDIYEQVSSDSTGRLELGADNEAQ